jgi:hypothetical protein
MIYPVVGSQINLGDGSFGIATGDLFELNGKMQSSSSIGYLWLFTYNYNGNIYGAPLNISSGEFTSRIYNTRNLSEGKYMIVIQSAGKNGIPEVIYNQSQQKFISPWIYPVPVKASDNPYVKIRQIEQFCIDNKQYCDDTFYTTNVTIEKPFIQFRDMYQYSFSDIYQGKSGERDITKSGLLYVGGTTNLNPENPITINLDYNQSVTATIKSNPYGYYTWSAFLNISKLRPGSHKILISSQKTDDMVSNLEIGFSAPTPVPTPTPIKVVSNSFEASVPIDIGIVPVPAQTPSPVLTMMQPQVKGFVPVPTPTPTPEYIESKPGAKSIEPKTTNKIEYNPVATDAIPTPNKIPIDPLYIIFALFISITLFIIRKKV